MLNKNVCLPSLWSARPDGFVWWDKWLAAQHLTRHKVRPTSGLQEVAQTMKKNKHETRFSSFSVSNLKHLLLRQVTSLKLLLRMLYIHREPGKIPRTIKNISTFLWQLLLQFLISWLAKSIRGVASPKTRRFCCIRLNRIRVGKPAHTSAGEITLWLTFDILKNFENLLLCYPKKLFSVELKQGFVLFSYYSAHHLKYVCSAVWKS